MEAFKQATWVEDEGKGLTGILLGCCSRICCTSLHLSAEERKHRRGQVKIFITYTHTHPNGTMCPKYGLSPSVPFSTFNHPVYRPHITVSLNQALAESQCLQCQNF